MSFKIITDSTCNFSEEAIEKLDLSVISLTYIINGKEFFGYEKGQKFNHKEYYELLKSKVSAKTGQATPQQARELVQPILEQGHDVLYVGFSSGLSGTYNAVCVALEELKQEFPDHKIFYTDTLGASAGMVLLLKQACKMRDEGKTVEETHKWLEDTRLKVSYFFTVDDLWHLQRGGRLSTAKAVMGSVLSIKPILIINNEGKLVPVGKAKGRKKSLDFLLDKMDENIDKPANSTVYIIHANVEEDAGYLAKQIKMRQKGMDVEIVHLEPVVGCHTGPGVAAVVFISKNGRE